MKFSALVFTVFVLVTVFGISESATTLKPTTKKPTPKPTPKPTIKPLVPAVTVKPVALPTKPSVPVVPITPVPNTVSSTASPITAPSTTPIPFPDPALNLGLCKYVKECNTDSVGMVWGSDGKTCEYFNNDCEMMLENCNRMDRNEPLLKQVTHEVCKPLCFNSIYCPTAVENYVCGTIDGFWMAFPSECQLRSTVCQTAINWQLNDNEICGIRINQLLNGY